jgi:hypothetical protein
MNHDDDEPDAWGAEAIPGGFAEICRALHPVAIAIPLSEAAPAEQPPPATGA